jgi:hypothetical protein
MALFTLAAIGLAQPALARGWRRWSRRGRRPGGFHGGGFHGGSFHGGFARRGFIEFGVGPYAYYDGYYPYAYDDYYDDGGCQTIRRRVMTRYGWRVRPNLQWPI